MLFTVNKSPYLHSNLETCLRVAGDIRDFVGGRGGVERHQHRARLQDAAVFITTLAMNYQYTGKFTGE